MLALSIGYTCSKSLRFPSLYKDRATRLFVLPKGAQEPNNNKDEILEKEKKESYIDLIRFLRRDRAISRNKQ